MSIKHILPVERNKLGGFTLLEIIVVISIASLTLAWALPQFRRQISRASADHFTQALVTGLNSLRARQRAEGSGCEISFDSKYNYMEGNNYGSVEILFETNSPQCSNGAGGLNTPLTRYRFLDLKNIESSKKVEVQVSGNQFTLSPPGTSSLEEPLIILVRSKNWNQDPQRPLSTLCIQLSGNGVIKRGKWYEGERRCRVA